MGHTTDMAITILKCRACHHEWAQRGARKPARCPSEACRSWRWDEERETGEPAPAAGAVQRPPENGQKISPLREDSGIALEVMPAEEEPVLFSDDPEEEPRDTSLHPDKEYVEPVRTLDYQDSQDAAALRRARALAPAAASVQTTVDEFTQQETLSPHAFARNGKRSRRVP